MMLDDAARGGPGDGVMAGYVTDDPAYGGALQTAFGGSDPWKRGEGYCHEESDNELVHVDPRERPVALKPRSTCKVATAPAPRQLSWCIDATSGSA
jgi:hypothetical protein